MVAFVDLPTRPDGAGSVPGRLGADLGVDRVVEAAKTFQASAHALTGPIVPPLLPCDLQHLDKGYRRTLDTFLNYLGTVPERAAPGHEPAHGSLPRRAPPNTATAA